MVTAVRKIDDMLRIKSDGRMDSCLAVELQGNISNI